MITKFKHKGLRRFSQKGSKSGINAKHAERLRIILTRLDQSRGPRDMNLPGFNLHELKPRYPGVWSVWVTGNYRVTFRFDGHNAIEVDYGDYH